MSPEDTVLTTTHQTQKAESCVIPLGGEAWRLQSHGHGWDGGNPGPGEGAGAAARWDSVPSRQMDRPWRRERWRPHRVSGRGATGRALRRVTMAVSADVYFDTKVNSKQNKTETLLFTVCSVWAAPPP